MSEMPSGAGQATHSRQWLDYFSSANPPRKNQAFSANAESFGPLWPWTFSTKWFFDNVTSRISYEKSHSPQLITLVNHACFNRCFLRSEFTHGSSGLPQFAVPYFFQFFRQFFAVVRFAAGFDRAFCFGTTGYAFVEFLKDRQGGSLKTFLSVECTTLGRCGAVGIHPIHTVFGNQRHQCFE
jgi:hypothetical protein